jgi:salicylate hydroxylase
MRVVIAGGSFAGLVTGMILHRDGHSVTVLERGKAGIPTPAGAWDNWPSLRHPHLMSSLLRDYLASYLPDVHATLLHAGAVEAAVPAAGTTISCRRTTIDAVLRACAAHDGLDVRYGARVAGLRLAGGQVRGISVLDGLTEVALPAHLVIDATGRHSRIASWLPGNVEVLTSGHAYSITTQAFTSKIRPSLKGQVVESYISHGWWCTGFAADGDACSLALVRPAGAPLLTGEQFRGLVSAAPFAGQFLRMEPADRIRVMRIQGSTMRIPQLPGVVAAGDALLGTSPIYGQGLMAAMNEALTLAAVLRTARGSSGQDASTRWQGLCATRYRRWHDQVCERDAAIAARWSRGLPAFGALDDSERGTVTAKVTASGPTFRYTNDCSWYLISGPEPAAASRPAPDVAGAGVLAPVAGPS